MRLVVGADSENLDPLLSQPFLELLEPILKHTQETNFLALLALNNSLACSVLACLDPDKLMSSS